MNVRDLVAALLEYPLDMDVAVTCEENRETLEAGVVEKREVEDEVFVLITGVENIEGVLGPISPEHRAQLDAERKSEPQITMRFVARHRAETDSCERTTPGCCIYHPDDEGPCEAW